MSEEKIGMYTAEEILEFMTDGEGRGFMGRSMFDAMYFQIKDLQQKVEQLEKDFKETNDLALNLISKNNQLENIIEQRKYYANDSVCLEDVEYILNKGSDKE